MPSAEALLQLTVAALMYATGETQADLGAGLKLSQGRCPGSSPSPAGLCVVPG